MSTAPNRQSYAVYSPRTPRHQAAAKPLAQRLSTLAGKTIAEVWDYQYRGDEIYAWIEEELNLRFPGVRFVSWRQFGSTHGSDEHEVVASLAQRFKQFKVDAVISGVGA